MSCIRGRPVVCNGVVLFSDAEVCNVVVLFVQMGVRCVQWRSVVRSDGS